MIISYGGGGDLIAQFSPALVIPWTIAHQTPLSLGFPRQEYWSGLPFPSLGALPDQGLTPGLLHCRWILLLLSYQESPNNQLYTRIIVSVNFMQHDNSYLFSSVNFYQKSEVCIISCICLKRKVGIKFTYFVYSQSKRKKRKN